MNEKIGAVTIRCPKCRNEFRSPIGFASVQVFESSLLSGNMTQCPKCGSMVECNKENMSYRLSDESGGFVGNDVPPKAR